MQTNHLRLKIELCPMPLFFRLKPEDLAKLMQYQWDNFGLKLEIVSLAISEGGLSEVESLEEIAKLMKQPPHHSKGEL